MPLTPPERWGTGNSRRRINLSQAFITQTYGGAAGDVVTTMEFPGENANRTGAVSGTITFSGTVVGQEDHYGTATGTTTLTGTIVGSKAATGAVAGSIAFTGSTTGQEDHYGTVAGSTALDGTVVGQMGAFGSIAVQTDFSGTITGTSSGGTPTPEPTVDVGGMSPYRRQQLLIAQQRAVEQQAAALAAANARSGSVRGSVAIRGTIRGQRGASGRARSEPITYRACATGTKSTRASVRARAEYRGTVAGFGVQSISTAELRRLRDDAELLLII